VYSYISVSTTHLCSSP